MSKAFSKKLFLFAAVVAVALVMVCQTAIAKDVPGGTAPPVSYYWYAHALMNDLVTYFEIEPHLGITLKITKQRVFGENGMQVAWEPETDVVVLNPDQNSYHESICWNFRYEYRLYKKVGDAWKFASHRVFVICAGDNYTPPSGLWPIGCMEY
jgi:hypothetical protein